MATLTAVDLLNASRYATHQQRLHMIPKWRRKFPHIFLDYEIRAADNDDYYVPPRLRDKAISVKVTFSKAGCESMTCYPFHETGNIDYSTPFNYTQTSETTVAYANPACYHLDRAAATREGAENEVQAPELRYTDGGKCILVDTLTKMYFNTPYLRTEEHLIQGVDDVPAFNITADDPLFPERFIGHFNEAYCRRFGRDLINGGCSVQWWESLIGFVLGDTIYITLKLLSTNIFKELRDFNYTRPSPILPTKPTVDSDAILQRWLRARDDRVDVDFENSFPDYQTLADLGIGDNEKLIYTAEHGFSRVPSQTRRRLDFREAIARVEPYIDDATLNDIISQFLEDNALIFGIATDLGFELLLNQFKGLLKNLNTKIIPALKRMLMLSSKRLTNKLLGETYKAILVHSINRMALKAISTMAKAMTRILIKASSVVGLILIIFTLVDLILAFWDPFGYNNMFPREFPHDLSLAFLSAYFSGLQNESVDFVEFLPEYFNDLIEDDDTAILDSLFYILDYVSELEVNSNGQQLNFEQSETIEDFDEITLIGSVLASSALYTRLDFMEYTERQNRLLFNDENSNFVQVALAGSWIAGAALIYLLPHNNINVLPLFVIFLLIALYTVVNSSLTYYLNVQKYVLRTPNEWWKNLYT
ncbi:p74 [Malacosoma neustria nucleopolyhedrovirus]|uniref:p74 n=1 Tax=Malacosoma neustria nuclear polyhedrosis virus TaxID=38012 RepID=UPI000E3602F0|nr:p74 [Malacosoma neustria nucleopolyhedrovirus]AUF81548.1 p74 [Malacosoma neustria nucleopolyhedrovirus]